MVDIFRIFRIYYNKEYIFTIYFIWWIYLVFLNGGYI